MHIWIQTYVNFVLMKLITYPYITQTYVSLILIKLITYLSGE